MLEYLEKQSCCIFILNYSCHNLIGIFYPMVFNSAFMPPADACSLVPLYCCQQARLFFMSPTYRFEASTSSDIINLHLGILYDVLQRVRRSYLFPESNTSLSALARMERSFGRSFIYYPSILQLIFNILVEVL